jgi:hypothetical protein
MTLLPYTQIRDYTATLIERDWELNLANRIKFLGRATLEKTNVMSCTIYIGA